VRVLARSLEKAERLFRAAHEVEIAVGDMTDAAAVEAALAGCDAVVHAAATVSFDRRHEARLREANLAGVRHVLGGAHARGLRALYVSSLTVILDPRGGAPHADSPLVKPRTPYARSKVAAEEAVRALVAAGARVATVYPNGVIGPDDPGWSESVAALRGFVANTLDSTGGVSLLDVRDLALFCVRLLETRRAGRFVIGGQFHSWDTLVRTLEPQVGRKILRIRAPGALLRLAGRAIDLARRVRPIESPISREAMEYATRMRALPNDPALAELGVVLRPLMDTYRDTLRSLEARGRLRRTTPPSASTSL
jgi:nucleoside-diphosphate-sugar epimerase